MAKRKITKRTVDALKPGELVWDADVRGFAVRRQRDARVYLVKYRFGNRQRWYTIGEHGSHWTVEGARTKARAVLGDVAKKIDPAALREAERNRDTVAELCDRYLEDYAEDHKRASTVKTDRINIKNHIKPILGRMNVAEVVRADVDHFKRAVKDGKTARDVKRGRGGAPSSGAGPGPPTVASLSCPTCSTLPNGGAGVPRAPTPAGTWISTASNAASGSCRRRSWRASGTP